MATSLNPYIHFKDNAREAMEFYKSVFGGELTLSTFGQFGAELPPGTNPDGVMHSMLETPGGLRIMAADTPPGMAGSEGSQITISLSGDDGDELRHFWDGLSDGGTVQVPLERQMWGDEFGQCADRYGIEWMVNIAGPSADVPQL